MVSSLAYRHTSEMSNKSTDHIGMEIREQGATTGHKTNLCQSKAVLYILIVNNLCRAFLYEITVHSNLLPGLSPIPETKPLVLMLTQHFPSCSAMPTPHNYPPTPGIYVPQVFVGGYPITKANLIF